MQPYLTGEPFVPVMNAPNVQVSTVRDCTERSHEIPHILAVRKVSSRPALVYMRQETRRWSSLHTRATLQYWVAHGRRGAYTICGGAIFELGVRHRHNPAPNIHLSEPPLSKFSLHKIFWGPADCNLHHTHAWSYRV
jgi:hypothetical protein